MEFENLLKLVKTVSDSSLTSFEYEGDGVKVSLGADRTVGVVGQKTVTLPVIEAEAEEVKGEPVEVKASGTIVASPLVGTFYAAPAEDAESFVKVGDVVRKGQTLAIVEAMKLMNEIESELDGTVTEILVSNGEAVEYGQPLFRIS